MTNTECTPVVVGVGDVANRSLKVEDAVEPLGLMLEAISAAARNAHLPRYKEKWLLSNIGSISLVQSWTWPYNDLPGLIAEHLGATPLHKVVSDPGGNQAAVQLDEAARRIAQGKVRIAVVTGGEALASLSACTKGKKLPPPGWTEPTRNVEGVFSPTTRELVPSLGAIHDIGRPIQTYPLFENGFRAHRHQSLSDNMKESADLYAEFAKVAAKNPFAWSYGKKALSSKEIATVSPKNRMVCQPYPLLMNAYNIVNLAAAVILMSSDVAKALGIREEKWIYPLGGAGTRDDYDCKRSNFYSCPSLSRTLDAAFEVCGLSREQIDMFDIYSCFPIVPKLACDHLGLRIVGGSKPVTVLGGLTSFGGAGNKYSLHAVTEVVRRLRKDQGTHALVLTNGGVSMTYHHAVCLSKLPRKTAYPRENPLPPILDRVDVPQIEHAPVGDATIETYTVDYKRDGTPSAAYIGGLTSPSGHRFIANHGNPQTLNKLAYATEEQIGRMGTVQPDPRQAGRNLFVFTDRARM